MILLPSFPWTNHFHILLFFCITVISPMTITWGKSEIESPHVLEKMQNPAASVVRALSGHLQFCLLLSQAFQLQLLVRFQQLPLQGRDMSVHWPMSDGQETLPLENMGNGHSRILNLAWKMVLTYLQFRILEFPLKTWENQEMFLPLPMFRFWEVHLGDFNRGRAWPSAFQLLDLLLDGCLTRWKIQGFQQPSKFAA
jgi:hypothetical protein